MGPADGFTPEFRAQLFTVPQAAVAAVATGHYGDMLDQVLGEQTDEALAFLSNLATETTFPADSVSDEGLALLQHATFGTEFADDWR